MHRMGELTVIHVPTPAQEALRDLVRAREEANEDLVRARHRLQKFLLRQGRRFEGKSWTRDHWRWIRALSFEDNNAETVLAEYLLAVDQPTGRAIPRSDRDGAQGGGAAASQFHPHGDAREAHDRGGRGRGAGVGGVCLGDRPNLKRHEDTQDHGGFAVGAGTWGTEGEPSIALCGRAIVPNPRF